MRCWISLNFSWNSNKNKNLAQYERLNYISWNRNKEAASLETHNIHSMLKQRKENKRNMNRSEGYFIEFRMKPIDTRALSAYKKGFACIGFINKQAPLATQ